MWVSRDVISRKGGGGGGWGKPSFKFGEELTGNLGHQESNGPRGRAGILIELVSVRAGAGSWTTRGSVLAAASGTHSDFRVKSPPAAQVPSRLLILLLTSILSPLLLPPSHRYRPKKTPEKPQWARGDLGGAWGQSHSLLPAWLLGHSEPSSFHHRPEGFPCQTRWVQLPHPIFGCLCR